jgi:hypothetical protein
MQKAKNELFLPHDYRWAALFEPFASFKNRHLIFTEKLLISFSSAKLESVFLIPETIPIPRADTLRIFEANPSTLLTPCPNHITAVLEGKNQRLRACPQHVANFFYSEILTAICTSFSVYK